MTTKSQPTSGGAQTHPVAVIAKLLMLTERRVQQLVASGHIPKPSRGKYELVPAVQGYIRFLKEQAERPAASGQKTDANAPDYYEERAWVYRHRREEAALKVAAKKGVLVFREDAVKLLLEQGTAVRAAIEATESSIADELAGRVWSQREIAEAVRRQHTQGMKYLTLANGVVPNLVRENLPEDWEEEDDSDEDDTARS